MSSDVITGKPRVSVIMPAYNAAATLQASVTSVLAQTCPELELIFIDDRSSDATWELVHDASLGDSRVVAIRQACNGGVAHARNTGLEAARGDYIAFLDSDDQWAADKLQRQLDTMASTGAAICYAPYRRVDEHGRVLSTVMPPPSLDYPGMLKGNGIGNLTGIYAAGLGANRFAKAGHEDYLFWLEMVKRAGFAMRTSAPTPLADYLVRSGSLSANKLRAAYWQWRIYRDHQNIRVAPACWYFANYVVNAVGKRL